jgi:hypothetical protein
VLQVSSATLKGAITKTLFISPSHNKLSTAVKVVTVFPSPISRLKEINRLQVYPKYDLLHIPDTHEV